VKDGENGFVVSGRSEDELSEKMQMLGSDSQLRHRFGIRSREIIARWTPEFFATSALELIDVVLAPRSAVVDMP
jgi:glycosyltransferase involved in cell wall biosynthesis